MAHMGTIWGYIGMGKRTVTTIQGLSCRDTTPVRDDHTENKLENEMGTGVIQLFGGRMATHMLTECDPLESRTVLPLSPLQQFLCSSLVHLHWQLSVSGFCQPMVLLLIVTSITPMYRWKTEIVGYLDLSEARAAVVW